MINTFAAVICSSWILLPSGDLGSLGDEPQVPQSALGGGVPMLRLAADWGRFCSSQQSTAAAAAPHGTPAHLRRRRVYSKPNNFIKLGITKLWKWRQQLPELLLGWSKLQQTKQFFLMSFRPATSYCQAAVLWSRSVSKVRILKKFAININFVPWQIHCILWSPLK